jgi:predicted RNase H-like nuclease
VVADRSFAAGVDGCLGGWVAFRLSLDSWDTAVEVVDLPAILRDHPRSLAALAIDIPIGLLDCPRACDPAARKLLGPVRGCSIFPPPCRAALEATEYRLACEINQQRSGRKLSRQAWCIGPKIKAVDGAITPAGQNWAFEVHPEVSFWAMNNCGPMTHGKKSREGKAERLELLHRLFPRIREHILCRPPRVSADDLLDAAAAAWSAVRIHEGTARCVCPPERDERGLEVTIRY